MNNYLNQSFVNLFGLNHDLYEQFKRSYDRPYHNLNHIEKMLIDANALELSDDFLVAIWFHDISDFIDESIDIMYEYMLSYRKYDLRYISKLIMASDQNYYDPFMKYDHNQLIFRDIDCSILASDRKTFLEYDQNILEEYSWIKRIKFLRKKFLTSLLNRDKIFHIFWGKNEIAKENIRDILEIYYE